MESSEAYIGPEPHIEVHKYYGGVVSVAVVLALLLQAFLPVHFRWANYLELPLLVTVYFALSKRNPSTGLLLGMVIGLLQDSLSRTPIGLYGIAKTLVGFIASSIGARIDVEHPIARFLLTIGFYLFHHAVFTLSSHWLLAQRDQSYITGPILIASVVNGVIAMGLFPLLDRFRKPS
ncbi:MAG TPA: rod shape-determining protein MreD [Candidatus Dormibacteraeota bacterium]|nr:rod shape-determining protein MreD [Candidatus Dormibacteraeota bacterium]